MKIVLFEFRKNILRKTIIIPMAILLIVNVMVIYAQYRFQNDPFSSEVNRYHSSAREWEYYKELHAQFDGEITEEKQDKIIKLYDDLKEKLSFNQSLLEVERIILLMEKDYQLYPFESFVSELKIHYSKEYFILMKLLEIVMKDCQEAKLGRETVKLTLSLMMNQKLRLKIFGF